MLVDTHCHINSLSLIKRAQFMSKLSEFNSLNDIPYIFFDSAISWQDCLNSLSLSSKYPYIYSILGFHPSNAHLFKDNTIIDYKNIIISEDKEKSKILGIGEIGLDDLVEIDRKNQIKVFREFLKLAKELSLPAFIHNRTNSLEIFEVIDEVFSDYERIIFHCFSQSPSYLKRIIDKGGWVSFSLNILRKKPDIISSLKKCPLSHILLETDSPYIKIQKQPSLPINIKDVYSFVAEIRGESFTSLEENIFLNVKKAFSLTHL